MDFRSDGVAYGARRERWSRCLVAVTAVVTAGLIGAGSAWGVGECDPPNDPATLCPGAGACTINDLHILTEGCSLDFSGRAVTVKGTLQAEQSQGSFKVTARALTLEGGALKARGDASFGGGTITLALTGPMTMQGGGARIDVSATSGSAKPGGTVDITAGSIEVLAGIVDASGATGPDCGDGGAVVLEAGDGPIRIAGVVAATSDEECRAGRIAISGGSVTIEKTLDAGGGEASYVLTSVDVTATTGDLTVASGGQVEASGTRPSGSDPTGGSGGSIALTAERGAIQVAGAVSATGAAPDGSGGSVTLVAANTVNVLGGTIDVEGKGDDSDGGSIDVSGLHIDVAAGAVLNADGGSTNAGSISLAGLTGNDISGTLRANGSNGGEGGTIALKFCSVTINGTMDVSSAGGGCAGSTDVTARTIHITSSARLLASPCCNPPCHRLTVTTGSPTRDPGSTIDPDPPATIVDPNLSLCCGNGIVDHADEQCDDGNRLHCDGCRPNCTQEPQTVCPEDGNLCTTNVCDEFRGCIAPPVSCPSDGITCTADCNPTLGCVPTPDDLRCDDGVPCTLNVCDPPNGDGSGCRFPAAPEGYPCDDGNVCTFGETCAGGTCAGGPLCCDDANPCTGDLCLRPNFGCLNVEQSGLCSPCAGQPARSPCTDDDPTTVGDTCDGNGTCVPGPLPRCYDDDPCTGDRQADAECFHLDAYCPESCAGQPDGKPCSDSNACTIGACQAGVCVSTPRDCDDGNPANGEEICIAPVVGCHSIPPGAQCAVRCGNGLLDPDEECDDDNNASGDCCSASCELEPAQWACTDEGNPCTDDVCDGAGTCVHLDNTAPCNDGDACTVDDLCTGGACVGDPITCGDGIVEASCGEKCDDGNTTSGDGCSPTCQTEFLCLPVPQAGCRRPIEPARSQLLLKNTTPDSNDKLVWKWTKGATTTKAEFGAPLATTAYLLCLYDAGALVSSALVPAAQVCAGKPCWKETTTGFTYGDKDATADGITKLQLKEGLVPGKAKILVKGKGINLAMPTLPMTQPVLMQLRNSSSNVCWEAVFSPPPQKNDAAQYKDKSDS